MTAEDNNRNILWALLYGNFLIGTGVLLPAGMLNQIAAQFSLTPSGAGLLILISGIVVGAGSPLAAAFTSRIDRRSLLVFALALYVIGHALSALVTDFTQLSILRALTVMGAAIFTPQAAATVGLLVPQAERPGAIAYIFIGWSIAAVVGVPAANLLADMLGWRAVYGLMALMSMPGVIWVWLSLKPGLYTPPLSLASWGQALSNPLILLVFAVTLMSFIGQFVVFSYTAPILAHGFGANPAMISAAFTTYGVAGVIGTSIASRIVGRLGTDTIIAIGLVFVLVSLALFGAGFGSLMLAFLAYAFFGVGAFSSNSLQQSRLAQIAPSLAAATIALNTSFVYLGQAAGTWVGGQMVDRAINSTIGFVAMSFMVVALGLSFLVQWIRREKAG